MVNLYAERDIMVQGEEYIKHIDRMTLEGLHSKSDIAAELAHRDIEIKRLREALEFYADDINWIEQTDYNVDETNVDVDFWRWNDDVCPTEIAIKVLEVKP
jgi:hypothetical protein